MKQGMRFCSMYFLMWDRYIRFPLYLPVWEPQAIPCRCRKKMRCLTPREKCFRILWCRLADGLQKNWFLTDVTTGASQDIKQATATARAMVTQYGMSSLGMINYGSDDDEVFIGRDLAHTRAYSEKVAAEIDAEVKRIIDECYDKAKAIIVKHEQVLHSCSDLLMKKEKIGQQEFEELFAATM